MNELKSCPFCGGEAELKHQTYAISNVVYSYVICKECGASTATIKQSPSICSDDKAIEAWNKRADMNVKPVKHGHWVISSDGYYPYCSECGFWPKEMTKFCGECGIEMREEVKE